MYHVSIYNRLRNQNFAQIPPNVFDEGLFIQHLHGIVVNAKAKVGKNCRLFHNTTIGISVGEDQAKCPRIGSEVSICTGAAVIGDVVVANGVTIAANAAVVKSVTKENCVVGGVPAKEIKEKAYFIMNDYVDGIIQQHLGV